MAQVIGTERTIGGAVGFGATWIGPGVSRLTTTADAMRRFAFEIGEVDGVVSPASAVARIGNASRALGIQKPIGKVARWRGSKCLPEHDDEGRRGFVAQVVCHLLDCCTAGKFP